MNSHGSIVATLFGLAVIWVVLLDAFETVVLPRRVRRHFKLTAWFYRQTWIPWRWLARHIRKTSRQQNFLGYFGPLSLILLLGFWAAGLILGFALIQRGIGGHEQLGNEPITFGRILYQSGETFFTLGYGDIVPMSGGARALSVLEAGMGFAFLGVVIGTFPWCMHRFRGGRFRFPCWTRGRDRLRRRRSCWCGWPGGRKIREWIRKFWMKSCASGSAGRRSCWRARFRIRC